MEENQEFIKQGEQKALIIARLLQLIEMNTNTLERHHNANSPLSIIQQYKDLRERYAKELEEIMQESGVNAKVLTFVRATRKLKSPSSVLVTSDVSTGLDSYLAYEENTSVNPDTTSIGFIIKQAREKAGLTKKQVAINSGISANYISRIENGKSDIQVETLHKIVELGLGKELRLEVV